MRFLKDEDYSALIRDEIKSLLLTTQGGTDQGKLLNAEAMAVQQIKHSLFNRYDTEAIFTPAGDPDVRDRYIVMLVIDCALYHLYTAEAPNRMPSTRSDRYQDIVSDLKDIRRGSMDLDLPLKTNESGRERFNMRITSKYPDENNRW